jgi:hypothetical protein
MENISFASVYRPSSDLIIATESGLVRNAYRNRFWLLCLVSSTSFPLVALSGFGPDSLTPAPGWSPEKASLRFADIFFTIITIY